MNFASFSAKVAFFYKFLGIVPGASCISHENSKNKSGGKSSNQQTYYSRYAEDQSGSNRSDDCQQRWKYHFMLCSPGGNLYASGIIRFCFSFQNTFDFTELTTYFFNHVSGCTSYRIHGQTAEKESHHTSNEHAGKYFRIHQGNIIIHHKVSETGFMDRNLDSAWKIKNRISQTFQPDTDFFNVRGEQSQSGQSCRTNGKSFACGCSCVSQ